ncbi:MAG: hypothetical protein WBA57_01785 [Elainellaceae cyanobacterium]
MALQNFFTVRDSESLEQSRDRKNWLRIFFARLADSPEVRTDTCLWKDGDGDRPHLADVMMRSPLKTVG